MIDIGAAFSGCSLAIGCAIELNRMIQDSAQHCPGERAIYTVDALHDMPAPGEVPSDMQAILDRLEGIQ